MTSANLLSPALETEIIHFAQSLVQMKSLSGQEGEVIRFIEQKFIALGYDEVVIDAMGNVLGRIGAGGPVILFDSHVDTVDVKDAEAWEYPPFGGEIVDGWI
jgi:acetylornithine deacetylase/succinyl-diaminopimelate desuccinylase-like protein